jgi:biotin-(acetyl-CoA carboxylase) ligase
MLQRGAGEEVIAAWRLRAAPHLGRHVEWDGDGGAQHGIAYDIDSGGALLVRVHDQIVRVLSGEVRWVS